MWHLEQNISFFFKAQPSYSKIIFRYNHRISQERNLNFTPVTNKCYKEKKLINIFDCMKTFLEKVEKLIYMPITNNNILVSSFQALTSVYLLMTVKVDLHIFAFRRQFQPDWLVSPSPVIGCRTLTVTIF